MACPFCERAKGYPTNLVPIIAFLDSYPVAEGHTLVVPTRHVQYLHELTPTERALLWLRVSKEVGTRDCNIGINNGLFAGQTVPHLHVHIIPRTAGDVADPRGGVRWVIPDKADYWTEQGR